MSYCFVPEELELSPPGQSSMQRYTSKLINNSIKLNILKVLAHTVDRIQNTLTEKLLVAQRPLK